MDSTSQKVCPIVRRVAWLLIGCAVLSRGVPTVQADCNHNGFSDLEDIATGRSADCNANRIPDECEGAPLPLATEVASRPGAATTALGLGDFDGDGMLDVAAGFSAAANGRGVTIYLNGSERQFVSQFVEVEERLDALDTLDFDTDGDLDLVAVSADALYRITNTGGGSFGAVRRTTLGERPIHLKVADLDGDELPDLAIADRTADTVMTLRSDGAGGFDAPKVYPVGDSPRYVLPIDLDGDADLDLVVTNRGSMDLHLLFNDASGEFPSSRVVKLAARPYHVAAVDLDGDDSLDLVVAADGVLFVLERQEGGFAESYSIPLGSGFSAQNALVALDANDDGLADVAVSFPRAGVVVVRTSTRSHRAISIATDAPTSPSRISGIRWRSSSSRPIEAFSAPITEPAPVRSSSWTPTSTTMSTPTW